MNLSIVEGDLLEQRTEGIVNAWHLATGND
jgi:hypothetical protein